MSMNSNTIGGWLAILLAVLFVIAGVWSHAANPPEPGSLIPCDYGMSVNCEP